jgi:hypothetical protein
MMGACQSSATSRFAQPSHIGHSHPCTVTPATVAAAHAAGSAAARSPEQRHQQQQDRQRAHDGLGRAQALHQLEYGGGVGGGNEVGNVIAGARGHLALETLYDVLSLHPPLVRFAVGNDARPRRRRARQLLELVDINTHADPLSTFRVTPKTEA